jgi:zinc/manganese transport system substrate-binding protein
MIRSLISFCFLLAILLSAQTARAVLRVVATTPDLAVVAGAIGGERVSVSALALPTQDPHWVDARPHLALDLARADVLLAVGAELEIGWLPTLQKGSRNGKIQSGAPGFLDCSTLVSLLEIPAGKVDRSLGDVHAGGNPHYMLDPRAVERVAVGIGKRLAELEPEGRAVYLENTKRFVARLREARQRWEAKLQKARGIEVFTYHRSLSYLAAWLGFKVADQIEPRPGIPPNPNHVTHLIDVGRKRGIRLIVQESWFGTTTSQVVAEKVGVRLIVLPGMPNYPNQSYVAFLDEIVGKLAEAL